MNEILVKAPPPFRGTEIHTLSNGLKIILKKDATVPVVALQVWAGCGAVDETPDIQGISHGLEHMVFKGTPSRSAGEITRAIESHGGSVNAATQLETTHYYIDIPSYGLPMALSVLTDTVLNPVFPQDELERERLVIIEEIHRRADNPEATLWDEFMGGVFKNTPYSVKVIGNESTVSALTRDDLNRYYRKHYVPANLSIVVAGDFSRRRVLDQLKSSFARLPKSAAPTRPKVRLTNFRSSTSSLKKPVQLTYLAAGIPAAGLDTPDVVALDLFADVLGGGRSARFFQRIREEKKSVLAISCDYVAYRQKGVFAIFMECLPGTVRRAIDDMNQEIKRIAVAPITSEELNRAKARIKSEWLHGSETPHGQASSLGTLAALGRLDLVETYLDLVNTATVETMMNVYDRYLADRPYHLTRIEPE